MAGLYDAPPAHAAVLAADESWAAASTNKFQAMDRTQPQLPMKRGWAGTLSHDYISHGTTTLFAALNIPNGSVGGQCMQRHGHQGFLRFLDRPERDIPAVKVVYVVRDNYTCHKHPKALAWPPLHPRWTFHFTPTWAWWLNAVDGFFAKLTNGRLKHGVFYLLVDLQVAINR